MALKITDLDQYEAPSSAYPYGRTKDDSGIDDGTPANQKTFDGIFQFFARLMDVTATVYNDLPESLTNGFQYINALSTHIGNIIQAAFDNIHATLIDYGTVQLADQGEVNAGTDADRVITPATLKGTLGTWTLRSNNGDVTPAGGAGIAVFSCSMEYIHSAITKTLILNFRFQVSNTSAPTSFNLTIPGGYTYGPAVFIEFTPHLKDGATQKLAGGKTASGLGTIVITPASALTNGATTDVSGSITFQTN